ncbi:Hypothetical predicted protein [Scomber scombrus]|uniref:Uncharacterized protein n=1 Tax=Scomber scombrus TaxID=13677 RepID=A0AAV1NAV0_SCOSC
MLGGNRPHEISMCLDLTPENVATVTDVIRYEYAHEPECSEPLAVGHRAFGSWLERQRYTQAPGDTADSVAVPWLHIVIGQDLAGNKDVIMYMMMYYTCLHE